MRGSWWRKKATVLGPHRDRVDDEQVFGANDGDDLEQVPSQVSAKDQYAEGIVAKVAAGHGVFNGVDDRFPADPVLES